MALQKCAACYRNALPDSRYCLHHKQALDSITNHYRAWTDAYGGISWQEFLDKLLKMHETGSWIKEVIEAESKK
ncbi:MAG TPA: hypothetical protein VNI77_07770 [Nitrososphaera sp.]|nr:hypothetical protein [Nitrososphaera sp.]